MTKSKKIMALAVSALSLTLVAGTWAYYTSTHTVDNAMSTSSYGDTLTEVFTPDEDWAPGETADKIVGVTNTGDYDIVVRISMEETWTFADGTSTLEITSADDDFTPTSAATSLQLDDDDGLTNNGLEESDYKDDGSVVYKALAESGWTYADGYWYYNKVLAAGDATGALLNSITLCEDTDMGLYSTTTYYAVISSDDINDVTAWTTLGAEGAENSLADVTVADDEYLHVKSVSTLSEGYEGYAGAGYVLTITSETCQATDDAILARFGDENDALPTTLENKVDWYCTASTAE